MKDPQTEPSWSTDSPVESRLPDSESSATETGSTMPVSSEGNGAFIGRYRIQGQLGRGGFGTVYLANDTELDRLVAIKLPHHHRMSSETAKRSYLLEARTLAKLDHPNIVPVFDFGVMTDGRCFVVSKYVDGQDLSQLLMTKRFSPLEIAKLIATVAEALYCVHESQIVHRDIKPANLLVGHDGRIFIADFGLALAESTADEKNALLGTPGYMSPEQIRREGHRVDGRTDQFSLGVVMYELLTGDRPFKGGNSSDVLQKILVSDPVPPSQRNPAVPLELSRICIKLLSRLASDRYPHMLSLAKDLHDWLDLESMNEQLVNENPTAEAFAITQSIATEFPSKLLPTTLPNTLVIPRGLRAFSRRDSYFFMDLVPGVRDREGVPESLSHWKNWVCTPEPFGESHRVGVISGPTGCGKSSLVRAGLIPMLGPHVKAVMVEASPDLTEKHLLQQLQHGIELTTAKTLPEMVMEIRCGSGLDNNKKLLIIIDQFEQWLHGNSDLLETDLLQAIRQCDGNRVQCLLLIRDDFWLALSRFMKAVEAPLQLGHNATMVDLFDLRHAKTVLMEFGRGYGALPAKPNPLTREQEKFLDGAIHSLAIDNKVIPVQLSLFAEMVKSRDWTMSTLHRLGGSVGIGSQFLNESFSAMYAPANQRLHEEAAKSVLQSMLPKAGTEIKTCRRTIEELRVASGYADRDAFLSLMTILESELKLITATDAYDLSRTDSSSTESEPATYQLSHDFLVPSIRDWLTTQQQATLRGRVEQKIVQQAEYWSQNRQRRFLPSFWEWLQTIFLVRRQRLGAVEGEMMKARDRLSILQIGMVFVLVLAGTWGTQTVFQSLQLNQLLSQLQVADTSQVPRLLEQIDRHGDQGQSGLQAALVDTKNGSREAFLLQLGRVAHRSELKSPLLEYAIHKAELSEVALASKALRPYAEEIALECWKIIDSADIEFAKEAIQQQVVSNDTYLRALLLLAALDGPSGGTSIDEPMLAQRYSVDRWTRLADTMTKIAVRATAYHPDQYNTILDSLRPASKHFIEILSQTIGQSKYDILSFSALSLLRDFTQNDPRRQTSLCLHASSWQRPYIVPSMSRLDQTVLQSELEMAKPTTVDENQQTKAALRRAMAAMLLLTIKDDDTRVWSILQRSTDLTCRSIAIQLARELRIPVTRMEYRLLVETDSGVLAALLQMLGGSDAEPSEFSESIKARVAGLYRDHPDAGVHSSAKWCLTQWNDTATLGSLLKSSSEQSIHGPAAPKQWFLAPSGNLMLKIPGKQSSAVGRDFLISAHEVTIDQFRAFVPGRYFSEEFGPAGDCPANIIKWGDAVAYCNWLSEQEGLQPFYPKDADTLVRWQPSQQDLGGNGYRLPQEAEWEFAARAGTTTDRAFGIDPELFIHYDWCLSNRDAFIAKYRSDLRPLYRDQNITRSKPVGMLLPNEYGLFDVLGNVAEWCNDLNPNNQVERAIRGGAAGGAIRFMNVKRAGTAQPNEEFNSNGFRIVRTIP